MVDEEFMLTTVDNPFDPFTQFDQWRNYDEQLGYHSLSLLARVIHTSDELSDADQIVAYENAVNEIVNENVSGMHRKVSRAGPVTVPGGGVAI